MFAPWRGQIATPSSAVEVALAERAVVVRAAVLERAVLAVQVVDAERDRARVDDLHRAGRQLLDRADVELRHSLLQLEVARAPAHSSGSGVPFALCSATFSVAEAEQRALEPDRRQRDADLVEQLVLRQRRRPRSRCGPGPSPSASTSRPARSRSRGRRT